MPSALVRALAVRHRFAHVDAFLAPAAGAPIPAAIAGTSTISPRVILFDGSRRGRRPQICPRICDAG